MGQSTNHFVLNGTGAVLSQFTGDNLAINQIFGLTESFAHDYFCPLCYCSREESQNYFKEKDFHCRTPKSYKLDIEALHAYMSPRHYSVCLRSGS